MGYPAKPLEQRFWAKVDKRSVDECWPWTGTINDSGRGQITVRKRLVKSSHRLAWEFNIGPIPAGLCVCHKCDNPVCCNPNHLFVGTIADNNRDCHAKGRHRGNRKLNAGKVLAIRAMHEAGSTTRYLAETFSVTPEQILNVVKRRHWKNVYSTHT